MKQELKDRLIRLADRYETKAFLEGDPSCFMHRYGRKEDQELVAFIAASLAFGRREQILSHLERIFALAGERPSEWVAGDAWEAHFPDSPASFYRTFSYASLRSLFSTLREILRQESMGDYFKNKYLAEGAAEGQPLCRVIARCFEPACTLVPRSESSAYKKMNMFLRWMVRDSSPVDLGLWTWYPKASLLMPLDTHVMQEATRLGLLAPSAGGKPRTPSFKCAQELSRTMAEAFPGDPVKGDYALFGLGVDRG